MQELNLRKYPHVYQHLSKLPESFDRVRGYIPFMNPATVWDRFYMSRLAYGAALQNQDVMTAEEYRLLDARMRLVGAYTVIVVSVNEDRFRARWGCKNEMYTADMAWKVNEYFRGIVCEDEQERHYYELPELPANLFYQERGLNRLDADRVICVDSDVSPETWPTSQVNVIINAYLHRLRTVQALST